MKKLLITAMALSCFAFSSYGQDKVEKKIIGKWCNPYTYKSTGELKGFEFKKGGKCSAINIPSLDLKTWKIDKDTGAPAASCSDQRMGRKRDKAHSFFSR